MSGRIPTLIARRVRKRARNRCEYCGLSQEGQEATFHIDHIQPRRSGGETQLDNLALACVSCSLRKGARTEALDPLTGEMVRLFHPRLDTWDVHISIDTGWRLIGRTAIGRASIAHLKLNRQIAVAIRREEAMRDRYP